MLADAATVVTAVGSSIAAGASWRSAASSSHASSDAREALGLTITPAIDLRPVLGTRNNTPVQIEVMVANVSSWPATRLRMEVRFKTGTLRFTRESSCGPRTVPGPRRSTTWGSPDPTDMTTCASSSARSCSPSQTPEEYAGTNPNSMSQQVSSSALLSTTWALSRCASRGQVELIEAAVGTFDRPIPQ